MTLGAKYVRRTWRGRKVYDLATVELADEFQARLTKRRLRTDSSWGSGGNVFVEVLTDTEHRQEVVREYARTRDLDRDLGTY